MATKTSSQPGSKLSKTDAAEIAKAMVKEQERRIKKAARKAAQEEATRKAEADKLDDERKVRATNGWAFFATLIGTIVVAVVAYSHGAQLTSWLTATFWIAACVALVFLTIRWRDIKPRWRLLGFTWWPLLGLLVIATYGYLCGIFLTGVWPWWAVPAVIAAFVMAFVVWRQRKNLPLEGKSPRIEFTRGPLKGLRAFFAELGIAAAATLAVAVLIAIPLGLAVSLGQMIVPARPFDVMNNQAVQQEKCFLLRHDIADIQQADASNDLARLKEYNLIAMKDGQPVKFAAERVSTLSTLVEAGHCQQ